MVYLKRIMQVALVIVLVLMTACGSGKTFTLEEAQAYLSDGNYEEAIEAYTALIEITPDDASLYMGRAVAYAHTSKYQEAVSDYTTVIDLDKSITDAYAYRGVMYSFLGEEELAKTDLSDAVELTSEADRAAAFDKIYSYLGDLGITEEDLESNEGYSVRVFVLPDGNQLVIFQFADNTIGIQIFGAGEELPSFAMDSALFNFAWYSPDFGWYDTATDTGYEGAVTLVMNNDGTVTVTHSGGTTTTPCYYQNGGFYAGSYLVGGSGSWEDPETDIYIVPPAVYDGEYCIIVGEVHAGYSGPFTPIIRD